MRLRRTFNLDYRRPMDTTAHIQFEDLDQRIDTERAQLVAILRQLADGLEALPIPEVIEPLTMLRDDIATLNRRAQQLLTRPAPAP